MSLEEPAENVQAEDVGDGIPADEGVVPEEEGVEPNGPENVSRGDPEIAG